MTIACSIFKLHHFYCAQPKWSVLLVRTIPEVWSRDEYEATCKLTLKKKSWLKLLFFFFLFCSSYCSSLFLFFLRCIYCMWVESSSCGSIGRHFKFLALDWSLAGRGGRGYSARKSSAERRREAMIADRMPTSTSRRSSDRVASWLCWCRNSLVHSTTLHQQSIFVTHAACGESWWRPLVYCASVLVTREYLPTEQNTSLLAGGVGSSWSVKWSSFKFQWGTGIRWWMWLIFMGCHL